MFLIWLLIVEAELTYDHFCGTNLNIFESIVVKQNRSHVHIKRQLLFRVNPKVSYNFKKTLSTKLIIIHIKH